MPHIFQYGSNTDAERLNSPDRLEGAAEDRGRAETLDEFEIAFDVWSQGNGCAASDLVEASGTGRHAWGVLYEVPPDRIRGKKRPDGGKTLEEVEGSRYAPRQIRVRNASGEEREATTFVVKQSERRDGIWTSAKYVGYIVRGLRAHGIAEEYVQSVIDTALETNRRSAEHADDESRCIESLRFPTRTV